MGKQKGLWPGKGCSEFLRREMRDSCKGYGEGGDFNTDTCQGPEFC